MTDTETWKTVDSADPCQICGKTTWCRVTIDGAVATCRKVAEGAHKAVEWADGPAYIHHVGDPDPSLRSHGEPVEHVALTAEQIDGRDRVYRALLDVLGLTDAHRSDLRRRGLTDEMIASGGYGSLPYSDRDFRLSRLLNDFAAVEIDATPGLRVVHKKSMAHAQYTNDEVTISHTSGLLIPCRGVGGKIVALKVRRDVGDPRYLYLSNGDPGSGSHVHVPVAVSGPSVVRVTEGELKADIATSLSTVATISVPGVGSWRKALPVLAELGALHVLVAFDADKATNQFVARSERALVAALSDGGFTVEVEDWEGDQAKGIDDALTLGIDIRRSYPEPAELAPIDPGGSRRCTDAGNALRLVNNHGANVRYVPQLKRWYVWDGRRWAPDAQQRIMQIAKATAVGIYAEANSETDSDQRKRLGAWAIQSEHVNRLRAMVELASTDPRVVASQDTFDTDPMALNVRNGTIDLNTGQRRPHGREDMCTKLIDIVYDPDASAAAWDQFLLDIMAGDTDMISFLRRAVGYSLTGDTGERVLFLLHGGGRNGKSTMVETISHVLGDDYATVTPPETILGGPKSSVPNDVARLKGARFVTTSETDDGRGFSTGTIKRITGNDKITARFLYGEWSDFYPDFKLWMTSNFKPPVSAEDQAIWDRLRLIPFNVRISEANTDRNLADKLRAESPGVLAWAVRGCLDWQAHGLGVPPKVQEATAAYRNEMDTFGDFLTECAVIDADAKVKISDFQNAYERWCHTNGEEPLNKRRFTERAAGRGFTKRRSTGGATYWFGVGLQSTQPDHQRVQHDTEPY